MKTPTEIELEDAIADATRLAVRELFSRHSGTYYYFTLVTTGEGHSPIISAWSYEALLDASKTEEDRSFLKWSYADSPYLCFGEEYFAQVNALFEKRPAVGTHMSDDEWDEEVSLRIGAMEKALAKLDKEGLFGRGNERAKLVINAEFMPPDETNTVRAKRLNPPATLELWLREAAE